MEITIRQRRFLRLVAKKAVIQGDHKKRIIEFYGIIINAAREEFTEDNKTTLDGFLEECHKEALSKRER